MLWPMEYARKWPDLSLRTKCLLLVSFPALATVVMFGVTNLLASRTAAAADQVNRGLEIAQEIQRLRYSESDISADVRAYFITGDETYANQVRGSIASFDSRRLQLVRLTLPVPADQQRLAQLGDLENAREERMFGGMARLRSGVLSKAEMQEGIAYVQRNRERTQALLGSMESDNSRRLETQLGRVESLRAQERALTAICLALGLVAGVGMTLLFAGGITGRVASLRRNVARLATGGALELLAGCDEIGALNQGLARVAGTLRAQRVALENALHGIAEVAPDGRLLWRNKVYAEMTGLFHLDQPDEFAAIVQTEDRPKLEEAIARMRQDGRAETVLRVGQPPSPTAEAAITFLSTPGASFYIFLLDPWGSTRGDAALIRAKEAAEASNRAKTEFLAKISHDIRTPLNAILGSADLLSQTALNFEQGEYVSMFQRNCRRLVALINDFLDFSRIEAGAVCIERAPVRVREAVHDAMATFREVAARKRIALGLDIDPGVPACVMGDPLRIQQILVNLLSNALKFTSAGRVDVSVKATGEEPGARLLFEVSDTGPGISREDQEKIFARFVQLPNPSNGQRGTGLGLTICRDLVTLMGGEIGVISRQGSGSTFYFNLPLEPVDPALARGEDAETVPSELTFSQPVRILLAEDTEDNRLLLEHYLRDQPVQLRTALNGEVALDAIKKGEQFDLILMDIDMPGMDGYTATRLIRAFEESQQHPTTPIVALSADAMQEAVRASLEAGCVAHVAKPVDRETLLATIRRFSAARIAPRPQAPRSVAVSDQVKALVPQYLASKTQQIEEARASLASHDFGPIRRFGHNLKGTGRGYGFPLIEELGREIERAAVEADPGRIASQLDALDRFVNESAAAVEQPLSRAP